MDPIITNLRQRFQQGTLLVKLIYINVAVFLFIRLAGMLLLLFNVYDLSSLPLEKALSPHHWVSCFKQEATRLPFRNSTPTSTSIRAH